MTALSAKGSAPNLKTQALLLSACDFLYAKVQRGAAEKKEKGDEVY